ncbi:MAG: chromosomal replication initiator protein DnaA [Ruminococcus sp.]|nr:chromosomal replication initiator protein DnaA [Ruminococcus sp.]
MKSFAEVFDKALGFVNDKVKSGELTAVAYDMWISSMKPDRLEGNTAYFKVQSEFQKGIILQNYEKLLEEAFLNVMGFGVKIDITPEEKEEGEDGGEKETESRASETASGTSASKVLDSGMYEYTFETFIVGSSNEFAHAACMAVTKNPGKEYNPLFLYSPPGMGKTHLLSAVQYSLKKSDPSLNIIYVTGEAFTNDIINAIRDKNTPEFRRKYRSADVLMVDDIQFISGKESTQEEFFHTFNELHTQGKQIILTSDRPPKDIKTIEDRIRTRFEWGLIADISAPEYETRVAITKRKAELLNLTLTDEVVDCIASKLKRDIRELEGCVKKLKASQMLLGTPPTLTQTQNAIREILSEESSEPVGAEQIIAEVAGVYGVTTDDIRSSKRSAQISGARKAAAYVIRELTQLSMQSIGEELGGKNHSTVSFYIDDVGKMMEEDSRFRETVEDIVKNIRERA